MKNYMVLSLFVALIFMSNTDLLAQKKTKKPHIVFVFGDEEYRSEESMPMLGRILKKELGAKITLCYPLDSVGVVNPNVNNNIAGLKALKTADMMILFCRWRNLPKEQAKLITDFAESGKPIVGFRTATHTFLFKEDSTRFDLNDKWPTKVLGQQWITHHGHFEDGSAPLTSVYLPENGKQTPILNGVKPFQAYSWLYHVDGGDWKINPNCETFLEGKSLRSKHQMEGNLDKYPLTQPVAWTNAYKGTSGKTARVFFTTLGHPFDFKEESMRKLALNGIYWGLGLENLIPKEGVNATLVAPYEPNNSGFGEKFKPNMKPLKL
jgi:uncharacterized protein